MQRYPTQFQNELLPTTAAEFRERMTDLLSTDTLIHKAQLDQPIIGLQEEIQWEIEKRAPHMAIKHYTSYSAKRKKCQPTNMPYISEVLSAA